MNPLKKEWEDRLAEYRQWKKEQREDEHATRSDAVSSTRHSAAAIDDIEIRFVRNEEISRVSEVMRQSFITFNATIALSTDLPRGAFDSLVQVCVPQKAVLVAVRKNQKNGATGNDGADDHEEEEEIVGAVGNDESDIDTGLVRCGPWTSASNFNTGIGRRLIEAVVSNSVARGARSLRLMQVSANNVSMALYTALGFEIRESLLGWKGHLRRGFIDRVRRQYEKEFVASIMTDSDLEECARMHEECLGIKSPNFIKHELKADKNIHGFTVRDRNNKLCGFTTGLKAHGLLIASSEAACRMLIVSAAASFLPQPSSSDASTTATPSSNPIATSAPSPSPSLLTCGRLYPSLSRWLLASGMRMSRAANLMTMGEWKPINPEQFIYCPSVLG